MVEHEPSHQELVAQLADFVFYSFRFSRGDTQLQKTLYEYFFSIRPDIYEEVVKSKAFQLANEIFDVSYIKVKGYILGTKKDESTKSSNHLTITPDNIAIELKKQIYKFLTDVSKDRISQGKSFRLIDEIIELMIARDFKYLENQKANLPHSEKSFFVIYVVEGEPTPNPIFNQLFQQIRDQIINYPVELKRMIEELKVKHKLANNRNRKLQQ